MDRTERTERTERRVSSYKSRPASSKPSGPGCVICFKTQTIYSVGTCDHPVCYECSTTMRVLCDQKECPICRRIMTKVIFTKEVDLFKNLDTRQYSRYNKKYGIAFDDHSVEYSFEQLMRCYCKKCYDRPDFAAFEQLASHMERNHRLYACRLCVENLKIFPSQRRWYNYDELARHEECGDPENTSHRGHPACHFCNVRYLDKDELYKHLRKEHYYCHFCDADGIQDYYMTYEWLRKHYHDKHYLCEEGNCINEQFTSVFRSAIDLQAHKAQTHSRELGKQGSKEARTLRLEFNLRPRHNPLVEAGRPNSYQPPRPPESHNSAQVSDRTINVRNTSDFPSLNGQHTTVLPCARTRKQNQSVNTRDLNSFPALGQEPAPPPKPQKQINNNRMAAAAVLKKPVEPSKPDRNKDMAAGPSSSRLPNQAKDFPSLDGNQQINVKEVAVSSSNSGSSWVSKAKTANENGQDEKKKVKKEMAAIKKKIAEAPKVPGPSDFPNLNKKMEANKSNLSKLGNKKKADNSKKSGPIENINNNNNQNGKKNSMQATIENNSLKKTLDNNKSVDNNKENNKPKLKSAEVQCNGTANSSDMTKSTKTAAGKTEMNNSNNNSKASAEPKKEVPKKKENSTAPLQEKSEETAMDINNPKDKKKRKKNENIKESSTINSAETISYPHHSKENRSEPLSVTPKIPPGFENSYFPVRAPPGLSVDRNRPPTQIKAPPGLAINPNINVNNKSTTQQEYLHPVGSTIRNQVLINNLMAALIPVQHNHYDPFEKFKQMSTNFRINKITAFDFYSYCVEALCPHSFETVFEELVLLLPDIKKQKDLLAIYNKNCRKKMNVEMCNHCDQVLRASDMEPHVSFHNTARS